MTTTLLIAPEALIEQRTGILWSLAVLLLVIGLRYLFKFSGRLFLKRQKQRFLWELLVQNSMLLSLLCTVTLGFAVSTEGWDSRIRGKFSHGLTLLSIALLTLIAIRMLLAFSRIYLRRFDINRADNLQARKVHTQIRIIERIAIVFILVVAGLTAALTFESVREVGTSLLASAGVLGIILGFAAQKSIALVFAGIQIAITQPIRLEDAVIVENEWGWIEEITLTYVVIRLWDRRRLIVPINYFTEKPFQNWTRKSADLLGTVFVYLDYHMPVEEIRRKVQDIVKATPLWDGDVCVVQVTDFMDDHMQLRILATARNSPETFDLRCYIREELLTYLREHYPDSLPRIRLEKREAEGMNPNTQSGMQDE